MAYWIVIHKRDMIPLLGWLGWLSKYDDTNYPISVWSWSLKVCLYHMYPKIFSKIVENFNKIAERRIRVQELSRGILRLIKERRESSLLEGTILYIRSNPCTLPCFALELNFNSDKVYPAQSKQSFVSSCAYARIRCFSHLVFYLLFCYLTI